MFYDTPIRSEKLTKAKRGSIPRSRTNLKMKRKGYILLGISEDDDTIWGISGRGNKFSQKLVHVSIPHPYERYSYDAQTTYNLLIKDRNKFRLQCPNLKWEVFRVGSKKCPIVINWQEKMNVLARLQKWNKFGLNTFPFEKKEIKTT